MPSFILQKTLMNKPGKTHGINNSKTVLL